jgi:hypothetical protein
VTLKKFFIFSIIAAVLCMSASAQTVDELRRNFVSPPDDARIMMRWWWFGPSVTKPEIERELRKMKEGGIGGVEVQPVYPLLPDDAASGIRNLPYLSDEFLEMLRFASDKAKELGMRFDLTLGSGWSFGGAKTPITEAAGQLRVERVKVGADRKRVPVPSMIPAEKLLAVFLAHPSGTSMGKTTELTDIRDGSVFLSAAPEPDSEVMFFISGKSGMQVKRPAFGAEGYVLNHLDRPSVDSYLKNTGDRLFQAFDRSHVPYSVFATVSKFTTRIGPTICSPSSSEGADTISNLTFPRSSVMSARRRGTFDTIGARRSPSFLTSGSWCRCKRGRRRMVRGFESRATAFRRRQYRATNGPTSRMVKVRNGRSFAPLAGRHRQITSTIEP